MLPHDRICAYTPSTSSLEPQTFSPYLPACVRFGVATVSRARVPCLPACVRFGAASFPSTRARRCEPDPLGVHEYAFGVGLFAARSLSCGRSPCFAKPSAHGTSGGVRRVAPSRLAGVSGLAPVRRPSAPGGVDRDSRRDTSSRDAAPRLACASRHHRRTASGRLTSLDTGHARPAPHPTA